MVCLHGCFLAVYLTSSTHTAEEAQKSIKGMEENAIHAKYFELVKTCVIWTLSYLDGTILVCRIQACGTRSCQREAETHQG